MRSKTSSFNLFRELFGKQLWVFALSCFGYFMIGPVHFLLRIGAWEEMSRNAWNTISRTEMSDTMLQMLRYRDGGGLMTLFVLGALACGAVSAWNAFSWLHSRNQVDLYHSLPVKRQKLFLIHVLIGVLDYALPALCCMVLSMLVILFKNLFTPGVAGALACNWLLGLIFSMYSFAIATLAMMLTGRLLVGILGTAVFYFVDILVGFVYHAYQDIFYRTYAGGFVARTGAFGPEVLSPFQIAYHGFVAAFTDRGWVLPLVGAAAAIVIGAISLLIYLKRPSEAAGKSMAFFWPGEGIRLVLSTLAGLTIGLIFKEMSASGSDFWFLFGLVLGFLFIYALMQLIYTIDIRRCFAGKGILIAGLVLTLGIAAFFRFDLGGYDTYLPKQDQIETVAFTVDGDVACIYDSNLYEEQRLEHAKIPCDEEVYKILERLVSGSRIYWKIEGEGGPSTYKRVEVTLKNGRSYTRTYEAFSQDVEEELFALYRKKEYREAVWPVLAVQADKLLGMEMTCATELVSDQVYYDRQNITMPQRIDSREDAQAIFTALQEDLTSTDAEVFLREAPYAMIYCELDLSQAQFGSRPAWELHDVIGFEGENTESTNDPVWQTATPVYPSFERTGKVLEEMGIEPLKAPDADQVEKILLNPYDDGVWKEVTDLEEIGNLLSQTRLICSVPQTNGGSPTNQWTDSGAYLSIILKGDGEEETRTYSGFLPKEDKEILVLSDRLEENHEAASEQFTEIP